MLTFKIKNIFLFSPEIRENLKRTWLFFDYDAWTRDCEFHQNLGRNPDDRLLQLQWNHFSQTELQLWSTCSVKNALSLTFESWSWHKSFLHSPLTFNIPTSSLFLFIFSLLLTFFHPVYSMCVCRGESVWEYRVSFLIFHISMKAFIYRHMWYINSFLFHCLIRFCPIPASLRSELNHIHASAIEHLRQTHHQESAAAKMELEKTLENNRTQVGHAK